MFTREIMVTVGKTGNQYREIFNSANCSLNDWDESLLERLPRTSMAMEIRLRLVRPADLGFSGETTCAAFFVAASKKGLCAPPLEIVPAIAIEKYSFGKYLHVLIHGLNDPLAVQLGHKNSWMIALSTDSGEPCEPDDLFLFMTSCKSLAKQAG